MRSSPPPSSGAKLPGTPSRPPAYAFIFVVLYMVAGAELAWVALSPEVGWLVGLLALGTVVLATGGLWLMWVLAFERGHAYASSAFEDLVARVGALIERALFLPAHADVEADAVDMARRIYDEIDWDAGPVAVRDRLALVAWQLGYSEHAAEQWVERHVETRALFDHLQQES